MAVSVDYVVCMMAVFCTAHVRYMTKCHLILMQVKVVVIGKGNENTDVGDIRVTKCVKDCSGVVQ